MPKRHPFDLDDKKYIQVSTRPIKCKAKIYNHSLKKIQNIQTSLEKMSRITEIDNTPFRTKPPVPSPFKTEVFATGHYPMANLGSSRHIQNEHYQIKGAGRNQLATRLDHEHSWGGMTLEEGFREYLYCNLARKINKRLVINNFFLGVLDSKEAQYSGKEKLCVVYRERFMPRLVQLTPQNLSHEEIRRIKSMLKKIKINNVNALIELHIKNYFELLMAGFYNFSLNPENITLDARVVDCSSLHFVPIKSEMLIPIMKTRKHGHQSHIDLLIEVLNSALIPTAQVIFKQKAKLTYSHFNDSLKTLLDQYLIKKKDRLPLLRLIKASLNKKSHALIKKSLKPAKLITSFSGHKRTKAISVFTFPKRRIQDPASIALFLKKWDYVFIQNESLFEDASTSMNQFIKNYAIK